MLLGDERRVARVDIASRKVLSTTTLPFTPGGIATGDGDAWVTEDGGDGLVRLDGTTGAIARRLSIPARGDRGNRSASPTGIAFGAGSVWVARGSETVRVDPRRGTVEHRFSTPLAATSVVFADGNVWVASAENGRIVRIDPVANRITAVTPLHGTVTDLAVDRDSVWVSIVPDDVVFRLSPDDGSVLATLPPVRRRQPCRPRTGCGSRTREAARSSARARTGPGSDCPPAARRGRPATTTACCGPRWPPRSPPPPARTPGPSGSRSPPTRSATPTPPWPVARSSTSWPTRPAPTSSTTRTPRGPTAASSVRRSRPECPPSRRTAGHTGSVCAGGSASRRPRARR